MPEDPMVYHRLPYQNCHFGISAIWRQTKAIIHGLGPNDIIIITGGFGQRQIVTLYQTVKVMAASECFGNTPILGICLGFQLLVACLHNGTSEEWQSSELLGLPSVIRRLPKNMIGTFSVSGPDGTYAATFRNSYGVFTDFMSTGCYHVDSFGCTVCVGDRFTKGCIGIQWHPEFSFGKRGIAALLEEAVNDHQ
jgi:imidazoleglycerol phosphate synthase glutamine amidotransferase subunit HisH